jgi:hypothetical protein
MGAGSPSDLRLPSLFWVLGHDVLKTLLHTSGDSVNQLRQGPCVKGMRVPAPIAFPTNPINMLPWWRHQPEKLRPDDAIDVPVGR